MSDLLDHFLKTWDLTDPRPLARTATSEVFLVLRQGTRVVLKLLTDAGVEDERAGAVALRCFDGRGAVRLLRVHERAHLLEYAGGDDLLPLVRGGGDDQATAIIAEVLQRLHAASPDAPPVGLRPLRSWFRALFRQAAGECAAGRSSLFVRAAGVAESLLRHPREVRVLHGDIHHRNIRRHPERGWLAFDPKGLVGERTFDAANTLCNPLELPELVENEKRLRSTAGLLAERLELDGGRVLSFTFAYAALSASWLLREGADAAHSLKMADLAERSLR